jgi:hypothetical protein
MLLAAEDENGVVSLLSPLSDEDLGVKVMGFGCETNVGKKQVSFSEFQKINLRVGTVTEDGKANIGSEIKDIKGGISSALAGTQLAIYLVKSQDDAVPLVTEHGGFITTHKPVENGAQIK